MCRTPSGEIHLWSKKKHHFKVGARWKSKAVSGRAVVTAIHAVGSRVLVVTGWPNGCFEWIDGEHEKLDTEPADCGQLAGDEETGVHAATGNGIATFDGTRWSLLPETPQNARLLVRSKDEVLSTGYIPGGPTAVFRGNARTGWKPVVARASLPTKGNLVGVTSALGHVFFTQTHDVGRGLYRLDGKTVVPVMHATGYCDAAAGTADALWHANGIELLCFDGTTWKSVPRVFHETTKA
jgi:hypothetical protein